MRKSILMVMVATSLMLSCVQEQVSVADVEVMSQRLLWHEAEVYTECTTPEEQVLGAKAAASGGQALEGSALSSAGDFVSYTVDLPIYISAAQLHIRYARLHWMEMPPSEVELVVASEEKSITRTVLFGDTGGWGSQKGSEWSLVSIPLGEMKPGKWEVRLTARSKDRGDVVLDGFFIGPESIAFGKDELSKLDRINISSYRYVGLQIGAPTIRQGVSDGFNVVARGFTPAERDVEVSLLDESGDVITTLISEEGVAIDDKATSVHIDGKALTGYPDDSYIIRTQWQGSLVLDYPVYFAGQLAESFAGRFGEIKSFAEKLYESEDAFDGRFVADYKHAIEYLKSSFAKIEDGSADDQLIASIDRTLSQYLAAGKSIVAGKEPYGDAHGDQRRAYVSKATGNIEPYRIVIPDSYTAEGKLPIVLALNHNENAYLDRGGGAVQRLYNEQGYVILSPRSNSNYRGKTIADLLQLVEHVIKEYPGIDGGRVYGTGVSAGGFGTYRIATLHPKFYTAIACSSGTGNWSLKMEDRWHVLREKFAPVPTLIIHGEADNLVPVDTVHTVAGHLEKLGIPYEMKTYPNHGHSYHNYAEEYVRVTLEFFDKNQ